MTTFSPTDAATIEQVVAWAAAERQPLEILGRGSKRGLGRPVDAAHTLDLSAHSGIIDYDAAELVVTARTGTPLAEIEQALAAEGQMLAFEPPNWSALLGTTAGATIGGTIACNIAGPRRVRAGAARDHLLGFAAVNGWGDRWKSGGRVVKNVTGYDMCKLQAGAYGTLSVLLEVSLKVLPRPETSVTLLLLGLDDANAVKRMADALNSPHEVSAAAHLRRPAAARLDLLELAGPITALRLEGPRPSVEARAAALETLLGPVARLHAVDSERLWTAIANVQPLLEHPASILWRINPTPSGAPDILAAVRASAPSADGFYDWGGGLLWLSLAADTPNSGVDIVRAAVAPVGGHATLLRAPEPARRRLPVFEPLTGALAALSRRVKAGFDPMGILNPGRMQEGV